MPALGTGSRQILVTFYQVLTCRRFSFTPLQGAADLLPAPPLAQHSGVLLEASPSEHPPQLSPGSRAQTGAAGSRRRMWGLRMWHEGWRGARLGTEQWETPKCAGHGQPSTAGEWVGARSCCWPRYLPWAASRLRILLQHRAGSHLLFMWPWLHPRGSGSTPHCALAPPPIVVLALPRILALPHNDPTVPEGQPHCWASGASGSPGCWHKSPRVAMPWGPWGWALPQSSHSRCQGGQGASPTCPCPQGNPGEQHTSPLPITRVNSLWSSP